MLIQHDGKSPRVAPTAYVAPTAVVSGDVTIGEGSRILFGAVLTADGGPVVIGENCIIFEHALVRGRAGYATRVGNNGLVGPFAYVNGANIGENVFIATGASVFPGARLGARSEVRINAVVHVNSTLPEDATVPIGWVAVGDPAQILPPGDHDRIWAIQQKLDFPGTVLGVPRAPVGKTHMPEAMARYSELFGRHVNDRVLEPTTP